MPRTLPLHAPTLRARPNAPGTSYLRVVVNAQCPLSCTYCHLEGDPARPGSQRGLPTRELGDLLVASVGCGIRKLKFVGGEPLLRSDLPEVIARVRAADAALDISLITSGVVPKTRLAACYEAGLSRCNVSIHGFGQAAFAERTGGVSLHALRCAFVDATLHHGRPLKLNYVYRGAIDDEDLEALLAWAADRPVVVAVLDDLSNPALGPQDVMSALLRLRGAPAETSVEHDPDSLATARWRFGDGLVVEIKDQQLGRVAPWAACVGCVERARCREGIAALRLTHTGVLRPCMDRNDVGLPLLDLLRAGGPSAVTRAWKAFVHGERASC